MGCRRFIVSGLSSSRILPLKPSFRAVKRLTMCFVRFSNYGYLQRRFNGQLGVNFKGNRWSPARWIFDETFSNEFVENIDFPVATAGPLKEQILSPMRFFPIAFTRLRLKYWRIFFDSREEKKGFWLNKKAEFSCICMAIRGWRFVARYARFCMKFPGYEFTFLYCFA